MGLRTRRRTVMGLRARRRSLTVQAVSLLGVTLALLSGKRGGHSIHLSLAHCSIVDGVTPCCSTHALLHIACCYSASNFAFDTEFTDKYFKPRLIAFTVFLVVSPPLGVDAADCGHVVKVAGSYIRY